MVIMRHARSLLMVTLAAAIAVPAGLGAADKRQRIDSQWRDKDVVIDGDYGEWKGPLVQVEAKEAITAAALNDGQFLYMVLSTSDPAVRTQILRQGLVLWFDPAGGDKKHFGLKFPVGIIPGERAGTGRGRRGYPGGQGGGGYGGGYGGGQSGGGQSGEGRDPEPAVDPLEPTNRLEVLGPEKDDAHSFVADMAPGIAVKIGQVEGSLVYELKVPIARTSDCPYAIEAKPGALIGFGLETPKMEMPSEGRGGMGGMGGGGGGGGMGGGGRGRGMGGGGGGRGGGRGGGSRSEGMTPPKPMKGWATIQLAAHVNDPK